ncbi:MAG: DUF2804 domain-containing protein [Actinobacteria bacterium]|nr:DUF2804 domain-containing protein [Actinomycetota bacterium]
MATHEPEITEAVDLCTPDGRRLNPAARGWSRQPLHRANLRGRWGRTKRWDYWGVLTGDLAVSVTYADVDYLGIAAVWWADLRSGRTGGRELARPLARGLSLPDVPGSAPLNWDGSGFRLDLSQGSAGTSISAEWTEKDGWPGALRIDVALPAGHESLNVVIPWDERRFQFTSKHQARPATGELSVGDETWVFGDGGADAWGVLDVGRGRWPYRTRWNWGGGAGHADDGRVVGIQIGGKWTDGTGFTENGVLVDGRLTKIGEELAWEYSWDRPLDPWRVRAPSGAVDLALQPVYDRHSKVQAVVAATEVHQVFGLWSGTVVTDDGDELHVDAVPGFAEESRSRW